MPQFRPCIMYRAAISNDNIRNGQLIVAVDTGEIFLDFNDLRTQLAANSLTGNILRVSEDGFFIVDTENRIGLKLDSDGLDAARLSSHFLSMIPRIVTEVYSETEYAEV